MGQGNEARQVLMRDLGSRITNDEDGEWLEQVVALLWEQSEETLTELSNKSEHFSDLELAALDMTLSDYVHGVTEQDNSHLVEVPVPAEEFFLRITFNLIPLVVEDCRPMLGQITVNSYGDMDELNEDDLYQSVSNTVHSILACLLPEERSLRIARGCYLHEHRSRDGALPSEDDLVWLSEHALEILPFVEDVYRDGEFDRAFAEEKLRIEIPVMREGVL